MLKLDLETWPSKLMVFNPLTDRTIEKMAKNDKK
jgi:hypothetical protein